MRKILEIKGLTVEIDGKTVLRDFNMDINIGDMLVLFGPNGSGKSTLIKAIMGFEGYNIKKGDIMFNGKSLRELTTDQRARAGIGVLFQNPPKIRGVKLGQLADIIGDRETDKKSLGSSLNVEHLKDREINVNYSGGEIKRSELFQVLSQKPGLLLLDEPESGVDIENVALMGKVINSFLKKHSMSALIITHTGYILDHLTAERACVLLNKNICCYDKPRKVFEDIRKYGYEKCEECKCERK